MGLSIKSFLKFTEVNDFTSATGKTGSLQYSATAKIRCNLGDKTDSSSDGDNSYTREVFVQELSFGTAPRLGS